MERDRERDIGKRREGWSEWSVCCFEREGEARSGLALPQDDLLLFLLLSLPLLLQLHSLLVDLSLLLHYAQLILGLRNTDGKTLE